MGVWVRTPDGRDVHVLCVVMQAKLEAESRDHAVNAAETANRGTTKLQQAAAMISETQDIGINVVDTMQQQRESLIRSTEKVGGGSCACTEAVVQPLLMRVLLRCAGVRRVLADGCCPQCHARHATARSNKQVPARYVNVRFMHTHPRALRATGADPPACRWCRAHLAGPHWRGRVLWLHQKVRERAGVARLRRAPGEGAFDLYRMRTRADACS